MYPYIHNDFRNKYIEHLENFIKDKDKRYNKLLKYFQKNWRYNKSFNFLKISEDNYIRRTNNIVECFHKTLNSQISHFHPKISFLVNKLGFFATDAFKKYNASLVGINDETHISYSLSNDIYNFIKTFHSKYGKNFDIITLLENIVEEKSTIYEICKKFLDMIFIDGDTYLTHLETEIEDPENNSSNDIINVEKDNYEEDPFLKEKENLIEKLNKLDINNDDIIDQGDMIFEDEETINKDDNYIKMPNGKKKIKRNINKTIENLP